MKYADVILPLPLENSYTYSARSGTDGNTRLPGDRPFWKEALLYGYRHGCARACAR